MGKSAGCLACAAIALFACASAFAGGRLPVVPKTESEACALLQNQLAVIEGNPDGKPYKFWFCDHWAAYSTSEFYVIALWSRPNPALGQDHNMSAGHFAISKRTGELKYFDLETEAVLPIPDVYYANPPKHHAKGERELGVSR